MSKFVILIALCGVMTVARVVECKPTLDRASNEPIENNIRVERSAQHAQNAIKLAGQMANEGIQAATKGMNVLATAAQQGISAGTAIAAQAAKSAISII